MEVPPKVDTEVTIQVTEESPKDVSAKKVLHRAETVPDIKRDTSGVTTQYMATGLVNIGALASGVCISWSSSALPLITSDHTVFDVSSAELNDTLPFHHKLLISQNEASWVASLLCLGAVCGSLPVGLISEFFGRKKTLLYLALPLLVSWILVSSSPNVYGLYVGRFVAGVAVGAFSVAIPPYIADIAEKPLLPTLANLFHVNFAFGILIGYILGLIENTTWISFLCGSIPICFFIAFLFLPESPAYLVSQGKVAEAKTALRYFRGIDDNVDAEIKSLKEYIRNYSKNKITFKELFGTKSTAQALLVSFCLMMFQQMSGIYAIVFYAETIFQNFAISVNPPLAAIILGFLLVTSTYYSAELLKRIRRRTMLMFSFSMMALSAGSLAIYYQLKESNLSRNNTWIPLLTLSIYITAYATGAGPLPWLILREIFPSNATRRATAITVGFHWLLAFIVTKSYQTLVDLVKPGWTLWNFAINCVFGTIFVIFFVPETKDKSIEEIQNEFIGVRKKKQHTHVIEVDGVAVE